MSSFDGWYEKTEFESWGQHTVADLEVAYKAGMLRAAEIAEDYDGIIETRSGKAAAYAIRKEAEND